MIAERLNEWDLDFEIDDQAFIAVDYDIQNIIGICGKKIPLDPLAAPGDQQCGIRKLANTDELIEQFQHGNWAARTGFVLDGLAFVEQVGGGNEWLALHREEYGWQSFDSISFYHMLQNHGADHCRDYILGMSDAHNNEPEQSMEPGLTPTM